MQLTLFTDYALRVLIYLASHRDRVVAIPEIARAYGISSHHLVKIVGRLVDEGLVQSTRGRGGGLVLAKEPAAINLGAVVRATEPTLALVECFDGPTNACPIDGACDLKGVLARAQRAFLAELDRCSLLDCLSRRPALLKIWKRRTSVSGASAAAKS